MLIWVDLETTGLNPKSDLILEIGMVVTDDALNCVDHFTRILHCDVNAIKTDVHPFVIDMHTKNGLWDACRDSGQTCDTVEHEALTFVGKHGKPQTTPMCGSSIGFDRSFLWHHMPKLEAYFSHRNLDVSTLTEISQRWYRSEWTGRPSGTAGHRALSDVLDSIAALEYYRENIFRKD